MKRTTVLAIPILAAALFITACGGGGGGDTATATPSATASTSQGVITALGSVVVNGVTFSTTNAAVTLDDNAGTADQLKVGMTVTVRGTADDAAKTGTAIQISARDAVEGKIEALNAVAGTVTVMGQTVRIEDNVTRLNDNDTQKVFADAAFAIGDIIEVHAFPDDQGGLRATRVVKKPAGEFEIKGFITGITGNSFGLSLTPGGAATLAVTGTLPPGAAAGSFVQVKANIAPIAGAITATAIKLADSIGSSGEKVHVEGIVTSGSVNSFVVNGMQVVTGSATLFDGGVKGDFAVGVKLEAEGPLDASGAIAATKISFRSNIRIEADASATSATSLTAIGKTVSINSNTRFDNGLPANGQHVEVRAMLGRDGSLIATRIVLKNPDARTFLQAPVTSFGGGSMTIMGTNITTDDKTEFRISTDSTEAAATAAAFFTQVKPNVTVVKVRWATSNTNLPVQQAEIQLGK